METTYEWDENKRKQNIANHVLDFADIVKFDWNGAVYCTDERMDYGELREIAIGYFIGRLTVVVFTERGNKTRIISWRKANKRDERYYEEESS